MGIALVAGAEEITTPEEFISEYSNPYANLVSIYGLL
ncbi:hypothetical protein EPIR_2068 [Erwinia piriflorinigrans CFBP 5888]|uniref:Uncharacterized protein n=1 Tax=Erwinia piriflorinigrans CFBP 5888 TaxID=1161919 RepID=V5Z907_9GAMM|nr:hypothetical protein EPIR_2068 [Erwinia piriflorinigrans CFBP 5888]